MVRRGLMGAWVLVGSLWLTQYGAVNAQEDAPRLAAGPSQGAIPSPAQATQQQANTQQGGGGGGGTGVPAPWRPDADDADDQVDLDQRRDGGTRAADREDPGLMDRHPLDSGGGGGRPANVIPVMRGNPDGVDAVGDTPARGTPGGGGGGGGAPATTDGNSNLIMTPYFMIIPDQEASPNIAPLTSP